MATIFVRSVRSARKSSSSTSPASFTGATRRIARFSAQSICHGTMFEWCSIAVITTSSSAFRFARPHVCATRLIASVVPRVKTISFSSRAWMNFFTVVRADS